MARPIALPEPAPALVPPSGLLAEADGYHHTYVMEGQVIAFGDAHFSDLPPTTAFGALVQQVRRTAAAGSLRAVVNVGDSLELPKISRHPPLGWDHHRLPSVAPELEVAQERLAEIVDAAGPGVEFALGSTAGPGRS
jgi:hypothetical protein